MARIRIGKGTEGGGSPRGSEVMGGVVREGVWTQATDSSSYSTAKDIINNKNYDLILIIIIINQWCIKDKGHV